jgi:hypothetical protein
VLPDGTTHTIGSGFYFPQGVAVDAAGNVFVSDSGHNAVKEVLPDGTTRTIGSGFYFPQGVAVDAVGNVFVADTFNNAVKEVLPNGAIRTIGSGFVQPTGVAVDADGDVFVADSLNSAVQEVLPDGTIRTIGSGFNSPTGVAVDAYGDVFVADYGNSRVVELSTPTVATVPSPLTGSQATAVSATLTGLAPGTVYYDRLVATGPGGTVAAPAQSFTTPVATLSAPAASLADGQASGGSRVTLYNPDGSPRRSFDAFPGFAGGVNLAVADLTGDGVADVVVAARAGGGPHVKAFDGKTGALLMSFFAYDPAFAGGVFVAAGDVNGDGTPDIITGAGPGGGPHVKVFDGKTGAVIMSFFAYGASFTGGVSVAAADVNGDGKADIITGAGPGGGPHVKVFDGKTGAVIMSFFAYGAGFTGGVYVAAGDVDGDGVPDIITSAGPGGGPHVKIVSSATGAELLSFWAFYAAFAGVVVVGPPREGAGPHAPHRSLLTNGEKAPLSIARAREVTCDAAQPTGRVTEVGRGSTLPPRGLAEGCGRSTFIPDDVAGSSLGVRWSLSNGGTDDVSRVVASTHQPQGPERPAPALRPSAVPAPLDLPARPGMPGGPGRARDVPGGQHVRPPAARVVAPGDHPWPDRRRAEDGLDLVRATSCR